MSLFEISNKRINKMSCRKYCGSPCNDASNLILLEKLLAIELTLMTEGILTRENYSILKEVLVLDPNPPSYDANLSLVSRLQALEKDNISLKTRLEQLEKTKETTM